MEVVKPSYILVQETLRRKILNGDWKPGEKIPSEKDLEKEFSLSRVTIAKGITNLVSDGMLWRSRGKGTFVVSETKEPANHRNLVKYIASGLGRGVTVRHGIIEAMYDILASQGYHTAVDFFKSPQDLARLIECNMDDCHAGFIIFYEHSEEAGEQLSRLKSQKYPFVLTDICPSDIDADFVISDNVAGGSLLANHLIGLGHTQITYITRPVVRPCLADRLAGVFRELVIADIELAPERIVKLTDSGEDAQLEIKGIIDRIMSWPERPTALAFGNDDLALESIDCLESLGVRVPEDISVAGYDNIDISSDYRIPLTTVAQDYYRIGQVATSVLLDRMRGKTPDHPTREYIQPKLLVRRSTKALCVAERTTAG